MGSRFISRIITFSFLILLTSLFYLQVIKGDYYLDKARNNYLKIFPQPPIRGSIYDREGKVLAYDKPIFNLAVIPHQIRAEKEKLFGDLANFLRVKEDTLHHYYKKNFQNAFAPVDVGIDIGKERAIQAREHFRDKIVIRIVPTRFYPYSYEFSHILGYVKRDISNYVKRDRSRYGYLPFFRKGFRGIEQYYDTYLKGEYGADLIEVDSSGKIVGFLGKKEARKGKDIHLTIDARMQQLAYQALGDRRGVIIVMDPHTGEILSFVSTPSFSLNDFVQGKNLEKVFKDKRKPLINRGIQARYSPGSVFKPLLAIAGLEERAITPSTTFECRGEFILSDSKFRCWDIHQAEDLVSALAHSCNIYFYNLGLKLGVSKISKWAKRFSLDKKTGIDLPYEKRGIIPDRTWKLTHKGKRWFTGDTLNLAIGQGYLEFTPLAATVLISAIANGGRLLHPYLAKVGEQRQLSKEREIFLNIHKDKLAIVREGLRAAVLREDGTAHLLQRLRLGIAGKTGTAQTHGQPHAWFAGYFPYNEPRYSVCVFLENGGSSYHALKVVYNFLKKLKEDNLI
jgi:penicillin-binding protein 2